MKLWTEAKMWWNYLGALRADRKIKKNFSRMAEAEARLTWAATGGDPYKRETLPARIRDWWQFEKEWRGVRWQAWKNALADRWHDRH